MNMLADHSPELIGIAESASTLEERRARMTCATTAVGLDAAERRVDLWRGVVTSTGHTDFRKRLEWDGLDEVLARTLVGPLQPNDTATLPAWAITFRTAYGSDRDGVRRAFSELGDIPDESVEPEVPLAFDELLVPLVRLARRQVRERTGAAYAHFDPAAHHSLERALLRRLTHICGRMLFGRFTIYRHRREQAALAALFSGRSSSVYRAFIDELRDGALFDVFREFGVAARLCATVTALWVSATAELIERVATDQSAIEAAFFGGAPLGSVTSIQVELGDTHNGGRAVAVLHFSSGKRVVYKPRSLALELFYSALVRWFNERRGSLPELRSVPLLDRGTHGWLLFVEAGDCADSAAVCRFYTRAGIILALVHSFNGNDFHLENLIAAGEHPMLIDLEALLTHRIVLTELGNGANATLSAARRHFAVSVARTGLLPMLKISNDECRVVDFAALASDAGDDDPLEAVFWRNINTDYMAFGRCAAKPHPAANVPTVAGHREYAPEYADAIADGFARAYQLIVAHRDELLADGGLVAQLRPLPVRFLFRQTSLYATLLERALHPDYLRDGADRFIQLDALCRVFLSSDNRPRAWEMIAAERRSLEQMDIPCFSARADSTALELPGGRIEGLFEVSAYDDTIAKLRQLDDADGALQVDLIRISLGGSGARGAAPRQHTPSALPANADDSASARFNTEALDEAQRIAIWLKARALVDDGATHPVSWLGLTYLAKARRYLAGPLGYGLMDGFPGIALFFAALESRTVTGTWGTLAREALCPLRGVADQWVATARRRSSVNLGAGTGLGGALYALARSAVFLEDESLLNLAHELAFVVSADLVAKDDVLDVAAGSAGAILGLLAVHDVAPTDTLVEQARICAAHILAHSESDSVRGLTIRAPKWSGDIGLLHGAPGIALALHRLGVVAGDTDARTAAAAMLEHAEDALQTRLAGDEPRSGLSGWSTGAAGLLITQLEIALPADRRIRGGPALSLVREHLLSGDDAISAGTLGRIDTLVTASHALQDPTLLVAARQAAARVLEQARASNAYRSAWRPGVEHLGVLHGRAGIGYALLRVAAPMLPSLLAWQ